ncbi:hypothetical protein, partial [Mesorhizobium sp. M0208]|uniref:hypothetical protein n=1 Tax=Mesorhizobium sp. M0208 TaxID=2956916 RepID=UPI003337C50C
RQANNDPVIDELEQSDLRAHTREQRRTNPPPPAELSSLLWRAHPPADPKRGAAGLTSFITSSWVKL